MQTKNCIYCHRDIAEKGYDLHLKICPKRPNGDSATQLPRVKSVTPLDDEAKVRVTSVLPNVVPELGTAEYMKYWKSLDHNGQVAELLRRKQLGLDTNMEVKPHEAEAEMALETMIVRATSVGELPDDEGAGNTKSKGRTVEVAPASDSKGNGSTEVFYPDTDPYFMVSENIVEALRVTEAMSHKRPNNLLITGQPGGGKTTLALQFAAKFNRPAVIADFGILQEPQQLFQTTRLIESDGGTITDTRESGFIKGIETENCVVIMDEFTRVENERCLNPLMPILDGRKSCWVDDLRRRVHVASGVIFIATINEGALFCGISSLDIALRDRFREIFLDYLPADAESRVLVEKTGIPKIIANSLAEFAYMVRTTPTIGKKVSTRQLLHAAEAYAEGTSLWQAVETAVGNYNDTAWRQQVLEVFSLNIKDEDEYRKWTNRETGIKYVAY